MSVEVVPFAAGLGAEIRGVDLRHPLAVSDRDQMRLAWQRYLVLLIRDQTLTDEQHMAFTRSFGELEYSADALVEKNYGVAGGSGARSKAPPEIAVISNIVENGKPIGGLGSGEAFWHTDSSFVEVPSAGSFLRAIELPPAGGATYFVNMYSALEALPAEVRERISGLRAVHSVTHSSSGKPRKGFETVTDVSKVPGAVHPLVRTHAETGRKCLFLGRRLNAYVVGLPVAESEALLDTLWAHTTQDKFTWRQDWRIGDLVMWDNRCTMHRRDAFDPTTRRLLHRTQIKGDRPA
jgi:taurine dioxygenase